MKICGNCGNKSLPESRFCDQCGKGLRSEDHSLPKFAEASMQSTGSSEFSSQSAISAGLPPRVEPLSEHSSEIGPMNGEPQKGHAKLIIERGEAASTEFVLTADESYIGRWDADNGIFPDVDLDAYDPDAKVSRKHARIIRGASTYMIEDLGSTNGTFVNRGRRLLPGTPQVITEGDEIIVGKTFLRFRISK